MQSLWAAAEENEDKGKNGMQLSTKVKPCKHCQSTTHTAFRCARRQKPLQTRSPMKRGKRLRPLGRIGKALQTQRVQFFTDHEPPYLCVYCLAIGHENILLPEWANVEHGESKTRHPDRRFDGTNLYVSCRYHNEDKGSMDIDEYLKQLTNKEAKQCPTKQD